MQRIMRESERNNKSAIWDSAKSHELSEASYTGVTRMLMSTAAAE